VVELWSNRPERRQPGARLICQLPTGRRELELQAARRLGPGGQEPASRWLLRFHEVTDRTAAEALRGAVVLAAPILDPEALWVHELCGARLVDPSGQPLGVVQAVLANPASDLLELEDGQLVPLRFVLGWQEGALVVDPPAGLLDGPEA